MNRRGFTLLELLIAGLLFALVGAGAFSTFSLIRDAQRRTEARQEKRRSLRIGLHMICRELRSALVSGGIYDAGLTGENEELDGRSISELRFISQTNSAFRAGPGESDLLSLSYRLYTEADGESEFGLYRQADSVLDRVRSLGTDLPYDEQSEANGWELLLPGVVGFVVEYFDGEAWQEVWDTQTSEGLPLAVRVSIELAAADEEEELEIARGQRDPEVWSAVVHLRQAEVVEDLAVEPEQLQEEETEGQGGGAGAGGAGPGTGGGGGR